MKDAFLTFLDILVAGESHGSLLSPLLTAEPRIEPKKVKEKWVSMAFHGFYHGQLWNAAELARSLGASENTARRYLDILSGAFMVRVLPPWFENLKKRQVKAPKVYIRDSGILHALLQIGNLHDLQGHPKLGASWEGFVMEQILTGLQSRDAYFWATHGGAELDLLVMARGKRVGFELKRADAPSLTRSMRVALGDLGLDRLWVVYPGSASYELGDAISVVPLEAVNAIVAGLR